MIIWKMKYYNELSTDLLYQILKVRQEVFVVEQQCNYLDADEFDQFSYHLMGFKKNKLVAYMRIVNEGHIYENISFGRILVIKEYRKLGIGQILMEQALKHFAKCKKVIVLSAQSYLINFYEKYNFEKVGDEYLEDNIPHTKMIRNG